MLHCHCEEGGFVTDEAIPHRWVVLKRIVINLIV